MQYNSDDARHAFTADKSFLAGIFGQENKKSGLVTSLGFILYKKFDSSTTSDVEWLAYDDL